jgi:Tol biopolymer transport system component
MVRLLVVLVAALLARGAPAASSAREATPVAPGALRVVEQWAVDIPGGEPIALSPDGRWLAVWHDDSNEVCAYETAARAEQQCAAFPGRNADLANVAWSPDGTRLALTEDMVNQLRESDLWLFEAATGTLTDLTDDGVAGRIKLELPADQREHPPFDLAPAWSPDGQQLVFARTQETGDGAASTALDLVPAAGGEPRELLAVADWPFAVSSGVRWAPDDRTILYAVNHHDGEPVQGIWAVDASGGKPRLLVTGRPYVLDVSPRGQALIVAPNEHDQYGPATFAVVDLASGQPVVTLSGGAPEASVTAAGFSPDGGRLLLTYGGQRLVVRDLASGGEQTLLDVGAPTGAGRAGPQLTWATNGLLFGKTGDGAGVLLRLAAS